MNRLFRNDLNGKLRVVLFAILWVLWSYESQAQNSERVVAVGGALTEIIYELGGEQALVGVDTTSMWPEQATTLPQIGYQRNLSAEGILSLQPTLLFATAEAGPPEVLQQLKSAGVQVKLFPQDHSIEGIEARIQGVAEGLALEKEGQALLERFQSQVAKAQLAVPDTKDKPKVLFLLGLGKGAPLAAGHSTAANAMIEMSGGANVFANMPGYKPVAAEAIISAAPDYLLVVDHRMTEDRDAIIDRFLASPGVKNTPAGIQRNVILMDSARLLGFGPRTPSAISELAKQLYPASQISMGLGNERK